jgi:hypothetical protein
MGQCLLVLIATAVLSSAGWGSTEPRLVELTPEMIINESDIGDPSELIDEQAGAADPRATSPTTSWVGSWDEADYPISAYFDLGAPREIDSVWLHDSGSTADLVIEIGEPGEWRQVVVDPMRGHDVWREHTILETSRYLRVTKTTGSAKVNELLIFERVPVDGPSEPRLIQEIDCGVPPEVEFAQFPEDASRLEEILGSTARVLPNDEGQAKYFAYRMGAGLGLQAGRAYLLELDYPEDQPRTVWVVNQGCETPRGFHTGSTVGDVLHGKYTTSNPESLEVPLAGEYRTWRQLFFLHDRFPGIESLRGEGPRPHTPEDGFWVIIAQPEPANAPLSAGAAVSRIRLYEAPSSLYDREPVELPDGLPTRRLFWREEMSDGVIQSTDPSERGVLSSVRWHEYKLHLSRYLGINTFAKDLLEFGANQGWDSTPYGGNDWVFMGPRPELWRNVVTLAGEMGFPVLPYYEYEGSKGYQGYGNEKRCVMLGGGRKYTHIGWCESANADVTDPDTLDDFTKLLDCTVSWLTDRADFLGAWLRPRPSGLPVSFADRCLAEFAMDTGLDAPPTREQLQADQALYQQYLAWWNRERLEFLEGVRAYLESEGVDDPLVLLTTDTSEGGVSYPEWEGPDVVTDDPATWSALGETPITLAEAIDQKRHLAALTQPRLTWDAWEWQHSAPPADPETYRDTGGIGLTYTINRAYTVADHEPLDAFSGAAGLTVVRHYFLNEDEMTVEEEPLLGYFVTDVERAGPYCMMAEALAMANGDPWRIGYLSSHSFNRGFPEYVQAFNDAFTSLPALPSVIVEDAASEAQVVVRAIATEEHGTWLAIVNTGMEPVDAVRVDVPPGTVTDAVTGQPVDADGGSVTLDLWPFQLRALRVE